MHVSGEAAAGEMDDDENQNDCAGDDGRNNYPSRGRWRLIFFVRRHCEIVAEQARPAEDAAGMETR